MAPNDLPQNLLAQLRSAELRRYAVATGWKRNEELNGRVAVFQHPSSELDQLVVPVETRDADAYAVLAEEAVRKLAAREERPAGEVLNDLLLPPADVIRFRTSSPEAETGSLPLERTVQLLTGVRRLLSAVAHSALTPQRYFPRTRRAEAEEFIGGCRVGQTERGSFTLAVACPLDLPSAGGALFENPPVAPFPRRVTSLLMRTVGDLARSTDLGRAGELIDTGRHPGMSANFCEALLLLRPVGDRSFLGVSSSWSRVLPPDAAASTPARAEVELRQEAFEAAEQLAPRLRPDPSATEDLYVGFVEELRGGLAPEGSGPSGEVWLSVYDDGDFVRARVNLTAAQYAIANAAHMAAGLIRLRGILRRLPRSREIESVTEFGPIDPDDHGEPTHE